MTHPSPKQPSHPKTCPRCNAQTDPATPFCLRCKLDVRYGSPKPITAGKCCYCKYTGTLSREHVFGLWLHNRYPKPLEQRFHRVSRPERIAFWEKIPVHHMDEPSRGSAYSVAVNNVCEACNNGWMSQLHVQAKPLVERFANALWPRLSIEEAKIVSRWAVNLESYARINTITQYQRDQLKNDKVPDGFIVSVGRMLGPQCAGYNFTRSFKMPVGVEEDYLTFQSTFFCIENVGFHTISSLGKNSLDLGRMIGQMKDVKFPREIWPTNDPPRLSNKTKFFAVTDIERLQELVA